MNQVEMIVLFVIGCASLLLGIGLIVWASVQKKAAAGPGIDVPAILKAISELMDAIGRLFPNQAARVGFVLILLGIFLIFIPVWVH